MIPAARDVKISPLEVCFPTKFQKNNPDNTKKDNFQEEIVANEMDKDVPKDCFLSEEKRYITLCCFFPKRFHFLWVHELQSHIPFCSITLPNLLVEARRIF